MLIGFIIIIRSNLKRNGAKSKSRILRTSRKYRKTVSRILLKHQIARYGERYPVSS